MRLRDAEKLTAGTAVHIPHLRVAGHVDSIRPIDDLRIKMMIKVAYKSRGSNKTLRCISFNYRLVQLS